MTHPESPLILLIEDDQPLMEMYKDMLRLKGFKVKTASDGKKALKKIDANADLILLDILMPGLNGFEVLKAIKSNPELKDIPVIILTNIGSESNDPDKNLALYLGAEDYLIKSLHTPDQIVARVQQVLSQKAGESITPS